MKKINEIINNWWSYCVLKTTFNQIYSLSIALFSQDLHAYFFTINALM